MITKISTAYHEAGHAVMAWYAGCNLRVITINPDEQAGILGRVDHGDADAEWGDLGVQLYYKEHELIARDPDGEWRLATEAEREHIALTDEIFQLEQHEGMLMVCAAGEAADREAAALGRYPLPRNFGSETDRQDALEFDPGADFDLWVSRTREFLRGPPVWARVEALASVLLKRGSLNRQEALTVIQEVGETEGVSRGHETS